MQNKKLIAYEGKEYTLEWYFDSKGKSKSFEYYQASTVDRKQKLARLLILLGDTGKIHNREKFRHEEDQIYVFKPSLDRFFCFFYQGSKIITTNAYEKKTKKMPIREKTKALMARIDYIQRCKDKTYYD